MQITVGLTAQQIPVQELSDQWQSGQVVVVQNLGPGDVYIDVTDQVTTATGIQITVGTGFEFPRTSEKLQLYAVSSVVDTDVRVLLID